MKPVGADTAATMSRAIDVPVDLDASYKDDRERIMDALERRDLAGLLARHGRNISEIARHAGIDRTWVHRLVRKHGL